MFDLWIETSHYAKEFETASAFLSAYENKEIDGEEEVYAVKYGGEYVQCPAQTVDELYMWMCSNECDWFCA